MAKIYDAEMQYFNVAIAKNIGINKRGEVHFFDDKMISRESVGLTPLLIYSIVMPCYGLKYRQLVDASAPIPISRFLSQAWDRNKGLGMPERIETDKSIIKGNLGFMEWIEDQGVTCEAVSSVKSFTSFARSVQDLRWTIWFGEMGYSSADARPIEAANSSLQYHDSFEIKIYGACNKSMESVTFEAWFMRDKRFCEGLPLIGNDWNRECITEKPRALPQAHLVVQQDEDDQPLYIHGLKELVSMWPGGKRAFFRGLNTDINDFDHWIAGRAHMPEGEMWRVMGRAGVTHDLNFGEYSIAGGYLLIAKSVKALDTVFNEISNGGDLEYGFEIIGRDGLELPMRVMVFAAWCREATLVLFPRKSDNSYDALGNYSRSRLGRERKASIEVFDTLKWVIDKRLDFESPENIGKEFGIMHRRWLAGY